MAGYFFNDEYATPDAIDRRRALINALAKDNLSTAPVGHWTAALARVVGAGADQYETAKLNETEKKGVEANKAALMAAFGLGGGGISPTAEPSAGAGAPASPPAPAAPAPIAQQPLLPNRPQMPEGPNIFERVGSMIPEAMGQAPAKPSPFGSLNQPQASNPTPLWMQPGLTKGVPGIGQMPVSPSLAFAAPGQMAPMGGGTQVAGAPNTGQPSERELVIRTIAAETSGKSPQEAQAIAAVILNRAKTRGLSPADVVLERNQFEPWNGGPGGRNDPMNIDTNSPRYQQAAQALAAAVAGQDPTGGATHFFAPAAQAALGRPAPAWAQGPGQQIGATAFYAPEGRAPGGAVPVGDMPAPGAQVAEQPMQRPAPGQFVNPMQGGGQGLNPQATALLAALSSPWAARNPVLSQVGQSVLSQQLAGNKLQYQTDGEGNIIALDPTGRRAPQVVYKAAVKPINVPENGKLVVPDANAPGGYRQIQTGPDAPKFDNVTSLRKEISALPEVKNYTVALPAYNTMVRASKDNSAAGDLAFVYGLAKVFDPDSVVREGEMKFSEAAQSIPEQVLGTIRRVVSGETRLDANTKEQLIGVVNQRMTEMKQQYDTRLGGFRPTFEAYKIDPKLVLPTVGDVLPIPKLNRTSLGTVGPGAPAAPSTAAPPAPSQVAQPKSKAEYDALPSGTSFLDPTGRMRKKP